MINLLPPMTKQTYRYARRNRILVHWITAMAACLIGAVLLVAGGYFYLNQQIDSNTKQIAATNRQLNAQDLGKVQKQVATISSNLRLAVQVLSKEILFSELLKQLAKVTPDNVVLTNLTIEQAQGGVDITAQTADYNAATQLQVNLADPKNQIFNQADIVSISCAGTAGVQYPCTATLRALFANDNPFLFINSGVKP